MTTYRKVVKASHANEAMGKVRELLKNTKWTAHFKKVCWIGDGNYKVIYSAKLRERRR